MFITHHEKFVFVYFHNSNLKDTRWHLIILSGICLFYIFCCLFATYGVGGAEEKMVGLKNMRCVR